MIGQIPGEGALEHGHKRMRHPRLRVGLGFIRVTSGALRNGRRQLHEGDQRQSCYARCPSHESSLARLRRGQLRIDLCSKRRLLIRFVRFAFALQGDAQAPM